MAMVTRSTTTLEDGVIVPRPMRVMRLPWRGGQLAALLCGGVPEQGRPPEWHAAGTAYRDAGAPRTQPLAYLPRRCGPSQARQHARRDGERQPDRAPRTGYRG